MQLSCCNGSRIEMALVSLSIIAPPDWTIVEIGRAGWLALPWK